MSTQHEANIRRQRERNRILVTSYVYNAVFKRPIPNKVLENTSLYGDYRYYESVRDLLVKEGLITTIREGKYVSIWVTEEGKRRAIKLLTGLDSSPDLSISQVAKIWGPFEVLRLSEDERESLLATFLFMYCDAAGDDSKSYNYDMLRLVKEDIDAGRLRERLGKAFYIVSYDDDLNRAGGNLIIATGYHLIRVWSYLLVLAYSFRRLPLLAKIFWRLYYFLHVDGFKIFLVLGVSTSLFISSLIPSYLTPQELLNLMIIHGAILILLATIIGVILMILYTPLFVYLGKTIFKLLRSRRNKQSNA